MDIKGEGTVRELSTEEEDTITTEATDKTMIKYKENSLNSIMASNEFPK